MRLWFSRASEISIRDQLVTPDRSEYPQRRSGPRGQRLPSTRDLARALPSSSQHHQRQLPPTRTPELVEFRKGSGIYVREPKQLRAQAPELEPDQELARIVVTEMR